MNHTKAVQQAQKKLEIAEEHYATRRVQLVEALSEQRAHRAEVCLPPGLQMGKEGKDIITVYWNREPYGAVHKIHTLRGAGPEWRPHYMNGSIGLLFPHAKSAIWELLDYAGIAEEVENAQS